MAIFDPFDWNNDGKLDLFEGAAKFHFISRMFSSDNEGGNSDFPDDLDPDELADMDEDERREAIEEAGYDPDDFDFD